MQKPIDTDAEFPAYKIVNAEELGLNLLRLFEQGGRVMAELIERADARMGPYSAAAEITEATNTLADLTHHWLNDPARFAEAQSSLMRAYGDLWNNTLLRMLGQPVEPVAEPEAGDNRFKDPEWSANPYFDFWKQAYLVTAQWGEEMLEKTDGLDERTRQKAEFYLRQVSSALSPSNFPMTNPEVLRETLASNAENLVQGMTLLAEDMHHSGDLLRISQTDASAFEVGRNLATTPGKVVYQNDVLQLIQYAPSTDKVRELPLLIVPPWINKYYILDLQPENSFVRWAVDKGYTVFLVSWANPDEKSGEKTMDDYLREGILQPLDAIERATGEREVTAIGYCIGGTLLSAVLALMATKGDDRIKATTFFATQVDFSEGGDLRVFIDEQQLDALDEKMKEKGYLEGDQMYSAFNLLRANDLIWTFYVDNYLLGKAPMQFDLLYWNSDTTRMPRKLHMFYLREMYLKNNLAKPNGITLGGVPIDLGKVTVPIYLQSSKEDHIAPYNSVFKAKSLFSGPVRFMLAGSGHIAGVINPPNAHKYNYWMNEAQPTDLDDWIAGAEYHPGSWWGDWHSWLQQYSGELVEARVPGSGALPVIEDAPGSYVKVRS